MRVINQKMNLLFQVASDYKKKEGIPLTNDSIIGDISLTFKTESG